MVVLDCALFRVPPSLRSLSFKVRDDETVIVRVVHGADAPSRDIEVLEDLGTVLAEQLEGLTFDRQALGNHLDIPRPLDWSLYLEPFPTIEGDQ